MKRALITGSEGFVGRHFTRYLENRGWQVDGIDIQNGHDCRDYFRNCVPARYDLVVHLAAVVGGRAKIDGDPLAIATNMGIDAEAFRWAVRARPGAFVYYSSSAAYPVGYQSRLPMGSDYRVYRLSEDSIRYDRPFLPDQTYGWAKLTGEMLAEQAKAEGVNVFVFRPFSGYGTDQSLDYPFPSFILRALRREDPFIIWGDGKSCRDWIHIDDVVAGTMAAVELGYDRPLNLCTGRAVSFNGLADMVIQATPDHALRKNPYDPEIQHVLDAPDGVRFRVGNPASLERVYTPKVTLEEGISRALRGQL